MTFARRGRLGSGEPLAVSRRPTPRTSRWVTAWLAAGAVLALLLLANSIRVYLSVWRILAVQQVRQELSRQVVTLEQALRSGGPAGASAPEALAQLEAASADRPLWIEIRKQDGTVLAREGRPAGRLFTSEAESQAFRNREPLYTVVGRPEGDVVVEVFPVFAPGLLGSPPPPPQQPTAAAPAGRRPRVAVEMAAPLAIRDQAAIFHLRRDLAIDAAAALALLATTVVGGLGFRSYARGRRLESQLEIARQVQSELLPSRSAAFAGATLATLYAPADQVGGDFFDAFETREGRLALMMGDVSGKGMPAALVTGVLHGAVRASEWSLSTADHERESGRLNALLYEKASASRYVTLFWCAYEPKTRRLRYVNAGHNPPLLGRSRGGEVQLARLEEGGPVLGLLPAARYVQAECDVCPGDVLLLYSDGLVEAGGRNGEEYGEARLSAALAESLASGPDAIRDAILASARAFAGPLPYRDDVTLVVAKFD